MRRSSMIAAVSLAAIASAPPAVAGNPQAKPGTVVKVAPSDQRGPVNDNESKVFLQTKLLGGVNAAPIEVRSIEWGPAPQRVNKVESFNVKQGVKPVGTSDLTMKRGTGSSATSGNDIVITASRIPWPQGAAPPPQGTLRIKVRFPWLACKVGKFYPKLIMGDPVKTYEFGDLTVTGCASGPEERITFVYGKLGVK